MNSKKCFLSVSFSLVFMLLCCAQCDHGNHIHQANEDYYTDNSFRCPVYTEEEFGTIFVELSSAKLSHFRKELEKKRKKWLVTGSETPPEVLWKNLRAELLDQASQGSECLTHYYDSWGALLEAPTEANEKKFIEAGKRLKADANTQKKLKAWVRRLYNEPEHLKLSEPLLAYQAFLYFVANKCHSIVYLKLKTLHRYLKEWEEAGYLPGIQLWEDITKEEEAILNRSVWFGYAKNREAITATLTTLARLKDHPYSLTYRELQETLPSGLEKLKAVLDEVDFKNKEKIKLLNTYLRLANIA